MHRGVLFIRGYLSTRSGYPCYSGALLAAPRPSVVALLCLGRSPPSAMGNETVLESVQVFGRKVSCCMCAALHMREWSV